MNEKTEDDKDQVEDIVDEHDTIVIMDEDKNQKSPPVIRTMRSDAETYIKEKKLSTMQIAASSYAQQAPRNIGTSSSSVTKKVILLASAVLLIVVASLGGWWLLSSQKNEPSKPPEAPAPKTFIVANSKNVITVKNTNDDTFVQTLISEKAKALRSGTFTYFPIKIAGRDITSPFANSKDFINILRLKPPASLSDNLSPLFNAFVFYGKGSNDVVVILKTINFEHAFSSMLEWEKTIATDWQPFLAENSSSSFSKIFQDEVIKNNDARILKRSDGSMILGYVFFTKKYLIITTSREALSAVLDKLIALPPQ